VASGSRPATEAEDSLRERAEASRQLIRAPVLTAVAMSEHSRPVRTVISSDGTPIAYERSGDGPAVILVGGAVTNGLRSFPQFIALAALLSETFTVYRYDRRGRGDSGDTPRYAVDRELEDLEALIAEAGGSSAVYGLSSGAVLAVEAAARGAAITKLALLEPPVPLGEEDPGYAAQRDELIATGRRGEAVELFLTGMGLPPQAIAGMRQTPEWPRLEGIAHTLSYDGTITRDRTLWTERVTSARVPTLVLDSDASSEYLRAAAHAAAEALPNARRHTLAGEFHDVPAEILAPVLAEFLADQPL
jgi:pimeloyl-ACP methyl ester carboxylesterase